MIPFSFQQLCKDLNWNPRIWYVKGGLQKVWSAYLAKPYMAERAQLIKDWEAEQEDPQQLKLPGIGF